MNIRFTLPRRLLAGVLLAAPALLSAPAVQAQAAYPSKPIRLVVPWPAGHTVDIVARVLAPRLQADLGQPVFVDDVGGASGVIGLTQIAKSTAPDGYTLLLTSGGPVVLAPLFVKNIAYDSARDFVPVGPIGWFGSILIARPDFPAKNATEMLAYLKANPGKVSFSSTGSTSFNRLLMELFMSTTGTKMTHVPYRGEADQLNAIMSGTVDLAFSGSAASAPLVKTQKVKGIAVATPERNPLAPDVASLNESGIPELKHFVESGTETFIAMMAPPKTPDAIVKVLNQEISRVLADPAFRAELVKQGVDPSKPQSPEAFGKDLRDNIAMWKKVVEEAHITVD